MNNILRLSVFRDLSKAEIPKRTKVGLTTILIMILEVS